MPDRLTEIRARLDAATNEVASAFGARTASDIFLDHAPADIAWLLRKVANERADNALHEDDIYDLRDQVNAAMDTIHHLTGNGQQFEWAMDYYAKRVKKQRKTRRPHSD